MSKRPTISTLILLRHGQSIWNGSEARFTGWCDVPLTVKGRVEAVAAGQLLRSRGFRASKVDVAFTSELQRAHETCELALASMAGPEQDTWSSERIRRDVRLNERHYGAVQGALKSDPGLLREYGEDVVRKWRRSMSAKPPAMNSDHEFFRPPPAPETESLRDCQRRALECFQTSISQAMFDEADDTNPDRTVVVVAHSNTIRALMAQFDEVPDEDVPQIHVPNSVPILYRFERHTRCLISSKLQSAAGHSHARWLLSPENHMQIRAAVRPGGTLTRAIFDAFDTRGDRRLSYAELEAGLQKIIDHGGKDGETSTQCGVIAVAKKILRGTDPSGSISLEEFETRAAESAEDLTKSIRQQTPDDDLGPLAKFLASRANDRVHLMS